MTGHGDADMRARRHLGEHSHHDEFGCPISESPERESENPPPAFPWVRLTPLTDLIHAIPVIDWIDALCHSRPPL